MAGSFIWSLTFTDIFSQWTENRAVWNKGRPRSWPRSKTSTRLGLCVGGLRRGQRLGIPDLPPLALSVGSTPAGPDDAQPRYRKNDQAHVEQKNWTHVRQLLGYERLELPELIR